MILAKTTTGKTIYDSFDLNEKQNFTVEEHKEAYSAMNIQRTIAESKHLQGDKLAIDDRRYFGQEARKHHAKIYSHE